MIDRVRLDRFHKEYLKNDTYAVTLLYEWSVTGVINKQTFAACIDLMRP